MLLTFEEPPTHIKAGWKENHVTFMNELKNLQAVGLTTLGSALKSAFDVLNINRNQTGIDTYGQGRCPFYLEPSMIVVITDGGKLSTTVGVQEEFNLPMHSPIPGSELTKEPFRWDQRLFSLVLRLAGTPPLEREPSAMVPSDLSPIDAMCEVTGGRSYSVTSQRMLMQCLESLVQKVQSGVVINFEKVGADPPPLPDCNDQSTRGLDPSLPDIVMDVENGQIVEEDYMDKNFIDSGPLKPLATLQNGTISRPTTPLNCSNNTSWHSCRKLIYVPRSALKGYSVGHWPIPEAYWPDVNTPSLLARTAHPVVKFTCQSHEPMVIENLPFDKYEMEPSPLTQYILSRKQPTTCWQVFISNSHKNSELGHTFGYLKASTNLTCVNLFVMPYNYPVLMPLLDELFRLHRLKPSKEWRLQFDSYLKNMPPYYAVPLRRALHRMGAANLIPDNLENYLSYSVLNYLKKLKNQAKVEFEKLIVSVGSVKPQGPEGIRVIPRSDPRKDLGISSNPAFSARFGSWREQINDYNGFMLGIRDKEVRIQSYRNSFDIQRASLLDQIARMRANYFQLPVTQTRLQDEDQLHNLPVSQMGNYQEYLKRMPQPLREIESAPVRQHMFGNPFKIDKRMMVDEADIDLVGGVHSKGSKRHHETPPGSPRHHKRRPGPLPRDVSIRRPLTPPLLPPSPTLKQETISVFDEVPQPVGVSLSSPMVGLVPPDTRILKRPQVNGTDISLVAAVTGFLPTELDVNQENYLHLVPPPIVDDIPNHFVEGGLFGRRSPIVENCNNIDAHNMLVTALNAPIANNIVNKEVRADNAKLRIALFKELRKPGRNYESLFTKLNLVQGSVDVRVSFVREVIHEALRFKRKTLVQSLEKFEQTLLQTAPTVTTVPQWAGYNPASVATTPLTANNNKCISENATTGNR